MTFKIKSLRFLGNLVMLSPLLIVPAGLQSQIPGFFGYSSLHLVYVALISLMLLVALGVELIEALAARISWQKEKNRWKNSRTAPEQSKSLSTERLQLDGSSSATT